VVALHLFAREDRLHMVCYMRANDANRGLVADVFSFTLIQEFAAVLLGLELGTYTHHVGSMHIGDRDLARVARVLAEAATRESSPVSRHPFPRCHGKPCSAPSLRCWNPPPRRTRQPGSPRRPRTRAALADGPAMARADARCVGSGPMNKQPPEFRGGVLGGIDWTRWSVVLLKPDCIRCGLADAVLERLATVADISGRMDVTVDWQVFVHYWDLLVDADWFDVEIPACLRSMYVGQQVTVALAHGRQGTPELLRAQLGHFEPAKAAMGTIRGDLGVDSLAAAGDGPHAAHRQTAHLHCPEAPGPAGFDQSRFSHYALARRSRGLRGAQQLH
ncbi:MAG: thymidylate synthase, partial [Pseudonocardiaceae bacterium]